ncbi:MAG: polysaccharide biosynthesis protein [Clostridia bacterium]|nr:polysaccharide biosynthesis protein [Clostridia bacterium]
MKAFLVIADVASLLFAIWFSAALKFDAVIRLPEWFLNNFIYIGLLSIVTMLASFFFFKIYKRMWQYFIARDYADLMKAFAIAKLVTYTCFSFIWFEYTRAFITWAFLDAVISFVWIVATRGFVFIGYYLWKKKIIAEKNLEQGKKKKVMIIGAGGAAMRLISELKSATNSARYTVVALIDDSRRKQGEMLYGVKVCGGREDIVRVAKELDVDEIYFAVPSATESTKKEILEICNKTGCVLKTLPRITAIKENQNIENQLRKVDYTDLLGREQIKPDLSGAFELLKDKTVLVTGGGGSIGGELVRQIVGSGVAKNVIIFEIAENGAYEIQQELRRKYPEAKLTVLIGSVRDEKRLCEVFEEYRPDIVYHAAAHKHVPLMEDSPKEAVKNNVYGTFNLAKTADKYGVKRFVMISTDKAVNPTNVMGATKRICEMIVQSFNKKSNTDFVAVRFGNVLGSNGSVIPLFKEQIESGGPVTVTHPDIIRYFMLIPEAVSLVLQAGANAKGGEIFILDMGSPVKIRELAENLIRLSGHIPGEDIEIKYTGLRDGEKLYEELLISEEGIQKTESNLIYVARPMEFDSEKLFLRLDEMKKDIETASNKEIVDVIKELVPTFTPNNTAYNGSEKEKETVTV